MSEHERSLPEALDAERFILGTILLNCDEHFVSTAAALLPDDFALSKHRTIFKRMLGLQDRGEKIDRVTIAHELDRYNELQSVDGLSYICSLDDHMPDIPNLDSYVRMVKAASTHRRLIYFSQHLQNQAFSAQEDPAALIASANEELLRLGAAQVKGGLQSTQQIIAGFEGGIEEFLNPAKRLRGLSTGFLKFDEITNGLQDGDLIIIAARPSMGKTSFGLNIAQHVAEREHKRVAIFSIEMSKESLMTRLLCSRTRIDSQRYRAGYLSADERRKLIHGLQIISEAPLFIDDSASVGVMEIHAKLRRMESENGKIGLVIVDYLQLMAARKGGRSRNDEVSELARGLKLLAKEMQCPMVVLSQLSRAVETRRDDHRPQLSDLRDSGTIEEHSDIVAFPWREEVYQKEREDLRGLAELIVAKNRNGPVGTCNLVFLHACTRFDNRCEDVPELAEE